MNKTIKRIKSGMKPTLELFLMVIAFSFTFALLFVGITEFNLMYLSIGFFCLFIMFSYFFGKNQ